MALWCAHPSFGQMTFTDYDAYCRAASEVSTSTLVARTQGIPKSQVRDLIKGMTDPLAIRMVEEVIEFAYSRSATTGLEQLRNELRNLCLAKKIFAQ
jgi:hypothetical protein